MICIAIPGSQGFTKARRIDLSFTTRTFGGKWFTARNPITRGSPHVHAVRAEPDYDGGFGMSDADYSAVVARI